MSITAERPTIATGLPLYRLHLMRAGYLLMGLGLAVVKWPLIINDADSLPLFEGVVLAVTPWRYVWRQYASAKGDRWR